MDVRVTGPGPVAPFLRARDLFETALTLERPVTIDVVADPGERTRVTHTADSHRMTISRHAASSTMARDLTLHEFAHMYRTERDHPSHTQSTEEALLLGLAGHSVEQRKLTHCYQIANHMKDIYADDLWLEFAPTAGLVALLETSLATALADRPQTAQAGVFGSEEPGGPVGSEVEGPAEARQGVLASRLTAGADADMTAVNAAFALALVERHDLVDPEHRLYDLAHAASVDAPHIDIETFREQFRSLPTNPDESEYRQALVDVTRAYAGGRGPAAD